MPSSYVYLTGELAARAELGGGRIDVACSDDHGRSWSELGALVDGASTLDLGPVVRRRYDYLLRLTLSGGASLAGLRIHHDTQHSQRALPLLVAGDNPVRFAGAGDEGTLTWQGAFDEDAARGKQVTWAALGLTRTGLGTGYPRPEGATGSLDIPVATPGALRRLRLSAHYRARDPRDAWRVQVSYDASATFADVGAFAGPYAGMSSSMVIADPPAGARAAVVRLVGS